MKAGRDHNIRGEALPNSITPMADNQWIWGAFKTESDYGRRLSGLSRWGEKKYGFGVGGVENAKSRDQLNFFAGGEGKR